jgi:hypothetical protein
MRNIIFLFNKYCINIPIQTFLFGLPFFNRKILSNLFSCEVPMVSLVIQVGLSAIIVSIKDWIWVYEANVPTIFLLFLNLAKMFDLSCSSILLFNKIIKLIIKHLVNTRKILSFYYSWMLFSTTSNFRFKASNMSL